jgi:ABC-type phosphate transport system substrate-binding protein
LRILRSLVAVGALAVTAATVMAVPAMADPINSHKQKVTPKAYDIVSVGSQSIAAISDQLSFNFNLSVGRKHSPTHPFYYSWDGVPSGQPNNTMQRVTLKSGCRRIRPDGSSLGIAALTSYGNTHFRGKTYPCADFARSSRPRKGSDLLAQPGGVVFDTLWQDGVTYATTSNTNAPNNLSLNQLKEIFNCSVPMAHGFPAGTWGALLGPSAKGASQAIDPILPQAGSGTLSFFAGVLGVPTTEPTCGTAKDLTTAQQPEENEGISKVFLVGHRANPNVIYPFSIGAWIAQQFHSAKCGHRPSKGQNMFGCNVNGVFHLNGIGGVAPTVKQKHGSPVTNPKFLRTPFRRFLYAVVPYDTTTSNHFPARLEGLLARRGYFCKQTKVVTAYGFVTTGLCGLPG